MTSFINFLQIARQDYTSDEQVIIGCPSQEQIAVMITSLQLQSKTPRTSESKKSPEPNISPRQNLLDLKSPEKEQPPKSVNSEEKIDENTVQKVEES